MVKHDRPPLSAIPSFLKNGNGINAIEGRAKVAQAIDLINIF
jgi:hypothetical protein